MKLARFIEVLEQLSIVFQIFNPNLFEHPKNVNIDPIYKIKTNNYVTSIQDFKKLTDLHINKKRLNYNLSRKINNNYLQKLKINKLIKFINKFK